MRVSFYVKARFSTETDRNTRWVIPEFCMFIFVILNVFLHITFYLLSIFVYLSIIHKSWVHNRIVNDRFSGIVKILNNSAFEAICFQIFPQHIIALLLICLELDPKRQECK